MSTKSREEIKNTAKGGDIDPILAKRKAQRSVPIAEEWTMVNDRESYRIAAGLIFQRVSGITACDMTSARSLASSVGQYWLNRMVNAVNSAVDSAVEGGGSSRA
jgi:hypothetical protein